MNIYLLGCWESSGKPDDCEQNLCISNKKPPKAMNNTKFCCCFSDMCNTNFTDGYVATEESSTVSAIEVLPKNVISPVVWVVSGILFVAFTLFCGVSAYFFWHMKKLKKADIELGQHVIMPPTDYSLDKLKLCNLIGN